MRHQVAILTATAILACQPARPAVGEWQKAWTEIQAAVPTEDFGREPCEGLLARANSLRERLLPSPNDSLDPAITDWLQEAGDLAFACSIAVDDGEQFRGKFERLQTHTAEINAAFASGLVR